MARGSESDLGVSDVGGDSARVGVSGYARAGLQESSSAPQKRLICFLVVLEIAIPL
ncbi:hypothetical protein ANAPRD1_00367 [Anaplasma phagocytophilum]|uniref:hypothetical protein n=1 Tax=Anaplasma phagocytophilum TaxID=948 RepID=UPI0007E21681|nr:hypothetical protein [Anaplasma phagocytophilum]SCV63249.1 hypothetical protein ANAPRD1_00367 [Anaplasma phagocytophilum]SCV64630.1 hypothetical protein ANAPH1_00642 [Anaplasma phagocytophilum]SCV65827.1 hypothetical protein ANAPH2_01390 [Anaplasma phagocytophilum]